MKILLVGTSVATVAFAGAASSQDAGGRIEVQLSPGDVFAGQTLNVIEAPDGVSATTTASGDARQVEDGDVEPGSAQVTHSVRAETDLTVHGWSPSTQATTAAAGNSLHAASRGGSFSASTDQKVLGLDSSVEAQTRLTAELSSSGDVTAMAAAVGNDQSATTSGGQARLRSGQYHYGAGTQARVDAKVLEVFGSAAFTAAASANQQSLQGQADHARLDADQVATGLTQSTVIATAETAQNLSAVSAAAANSVSTATAGGRSEVKAVQSHEGHVRADAYLTSYAYGQATGAVMAVANSVSANAYGPELTLDTDQLNSGGVQAEVGFYGGEGSDVSLQASAIGNAVHGSVCTECDGSLTASNNQVNAGEVSSSAGAELRSGRSVRTNATAVGNSAGYIVTRPNS